SSDLFLLHLIHAQLSNNSPSVRMYISFSGSLELSVSLPLTFTLLEVYLMGLLSITSMTVSGPPEPQKKHSAKGSEDKIICSGLNIPSKGMMYPSAVTSFPSNAFILLLNSGRYNSPYSSSLIL